MLLSKNDPALSRFEMERSQWEVEKAELQARIAFLQGKHCWEVGTQIKTKLEVKISLLQQLAKCDHL